MSRIIVLLLVVILLAVLPASSLPLSAETTTPSPNIEWHRQFGAITSIPENDSAEAVAVSGDQLYVVGYKFDSGGGAVAFISKYDANGNKFWTRQFGSSVLYAFDVAVDSSGVYIVGMTNENLSDQARWVADSAYIRKYDLNGNELWTRQFGSSAPDGAYGVAVDNSGVYVVGETNGTLPDQISAGGGDAYIRKYDINGSELWTRQFGTSAADSAYGIAVDSSGVYVAGSTGGTLPDQISTGGMDAYLRKYDINGNELWTRQFGTVASDSASSIDVHSSGIYVTGSTEGALPDQSHAGESDAYIRKYDINGNEVWTRQLGTSAEDRACGIAADSSGVYVSGFTRGAFAGQANSGDEDAFIRKYDGAGNELWTQQFGSSVYDRAYDVAVDNSNIYVVGSTSGTLPGQTSFGGYDAYVRKYDANSNELWTRQFGGVIMVSGYSDSAQAVAAHAGGIYIVGSTSGPFPGQSYLGGDDAYIRKYSVDGSELWTKQFGSVGWDTAQSIAVNDSGIYVAGTVGDALPDQTSAGQSDAFIRKYDFDGNELWTRQFGSSASDAARSIAVNDSGIYVAGTVGDALPNQTSAGQPDAFIRKYDLDGNELWTRQFGSSADDGVRSMAVDGSGVYVSGIVGSTLTGQSTAGLSDAFIRKYDISGNELWTRQFGSSGEDVANGVAVYSSNVYVVGVHNDMWPSRTMSYIPDAFVRKYDSDGNELWVRQFGSSESDMARAVAVDSSGIYVTGQTQGAFPEQMNLGQWDAFVRKYDFDGSEVWTKQFGSSEHEGAYGVAVDDTGVYVAGQTQGILFGSTSIGYPDAFLVKLTKEAFKWEKVYLPTIHDN